MLLEISCTASGVDATENKTEKKENDTIGERENQGCYE